MLSPSLLSHVASQCKSLSLTVFIRVLPLSRALPRNLQKFCTRLLNEVVPPSPLQVGARLHDVRHPHVPPPLCLCGVYGGLHFLGLLLNVWELYAQQLLHFVLLDSLSVILGFGPHRFDRLGAYSVEEKVIRPFEPGVCGLLSQVSPCSFLLPQGLEGVPTIVPQECHLWVLCTWVKKLLRMLDSLFDQRRQKAVALVYALLFLIDFIDQGQFFVSGRHEVPDALPPHRMFDQNITLDSRPAELLHDLLLDVFPCHGLSGLHNI
mmetsp:Transcript_16689/g.33910  ORF Transcript_16689/g.33910 Transcript_16689/m.33910 type:complete len:264 (-) Transcript_16689:265-1056(-)